MPHLSKLKAKATAKLSSLSPGRSSSRGPDAGNRNKVVIDGTENAEAVAVGRQETTGNNAANVSGLASQASSNTASNVVPVTNCPCWTTALNKLKEDNLQAYAKLEGMTLGADELAKMIKERIVDLERKENDTASSHWYGRLKRFLPAIGSVKGFSMAVSRLDPHNVAPYICAGVFCAVELAFNVVNSDDFLLILESVSESTITLKKWLLFETHAHIYNNPATQSQFAEISTELPILYGHVLCLLVSIQSHLDGLRLRKAMDRVSQIDVQWKTMLEGVKRSNKKCDAIRSQMDFLSKVQKDGAAVLDWISTRAMEESHYQIMEKTGVSDKYSERGIWLFRSTDFLSWQAGMKGDFTNRVLWMKGSPGTGKTTLICRVIETLTLDQSLGAVSSAQICHFYCSAVEGSTPPSCKTIIRSLLRQLSFSTASAQAVATYQRHEQAQSQKTDLSLKQWEELFETVVSSTGGQGPCIICIDALDECEDQADKLLQLLGNLVAKYSHVFLLLTSQLHIRVPNYFTNQPVTVIQTGSSSARDDIVYFIDTEMCARAAMPLSKDGVLGAEGNEELKSKFQQALVAGANGMFQWVKIWLAIIFPIEPIMHLCEAEDLLKVLDGQQPIDNTVKDAWRSLDEAYLNLYIRVRHRTKDREYKKRAYRIILGAYEPLTAAEVAEAVSVAYGETSAANVDETYIRELCHNFFIEDDRGFTVAHESAKLFLQDMLQYGTDGNKSQLDDYSMPACKVEMANLCVQVLMRKDHPLWVTKNLHPEQWAEKFSNIQEVIERLVAIDDEIGRVRNVRSSADNPMSINSISYSQSVQRLSDWFYFDLLCNFHFTFYIIVHWLNHWQDAVRAMNDSSFDKDRSLIVDFSRALRNLSATAIPGCVLLRHAYTVLPFVTINLTGFVLRGGARLFDYLCFSGKFSGIEQCIVILIDGILELDISSMIMTLDIVPLSYVEQYSDLVDDPRYVEDPELLRLTLKVKPSQSVHNFTGVQMWSSNPLLSRDPRGNTLLHLATDSAKRTQTLLNSEADRMGCHFSTKNRPGKFSRWQSRNACMVNKWLETPLHLATRAGNCNVVSMLIEAGAAEMLAENIHGVQRDVYIVNAGDFYGSTPLSIAAQNSSSSLVIEELLRVPNIEINSFDIYGKTPLHYLCEQAPFPEKLRTVTLFLNNDQIQVDVADADGNTPLQLATWAGDADVVEILCNRPDVDPDKVNQDNETALWHARFNRLEMIGSDLHRYERIIEALLATGKVNPNPLNDQGKSPEAVWQEMFGEL